MSAAPKPAMSAKPAGWLYTSPSGRTQHAAPLDEREQGLCDEGWTETPLYSADTIAALERGAGPAGVLAQRLGEVVRERDALRLQNEKLRHEPLTRAEVVFTLREALELVEAFGGDDACEMTVRELPQGAVSDEGRPGAAGLYAHVTDYPEEGCIYLGPVDPDAAQSTEGER